MQFRQAGAIKHSGCNVGRRQSAQSAQTNSETRWWKVDDLDSFWRSGDFLSRSLTRAVQWDNDPTQSYRTLTFKLSAHKTGGGCFQFPSSHLDGGQKKKIPILKKFIRFVILNKDPNCSGVVIQQASDEQTAWKKITERYLNTWTDRRALLTVINYGTLDPHDGKSPRFHIQANASVTVGLNP